MWLLARPVLATGLSLSRMGGVALSPVLTGLTQLWVLVSCDWSVLHVDPGEQFEITPTQP